ncbi:MAG: endolytic transglycosylase MltG [Candidatus Pacebacteria bacterium]|nr:endolytic transglycosylase MltG [Candidatus Paceibacterota bacterium]
MLYVLKQLGKPVFTAALIVLGVFFIFEFFLLKNKKESREITVVIYEGQTVREIDDNLKDLGIFKNGESLLTLSQSLEGRLFPDTYRFFKNSSAVVVVEKILENFYKKADPLLLKDSENYDRNLILASLIEREVPRFEERKIVAGILLKRLETGMPLQIDASLCYIKSHAYSINNLAKTEAEVDSGLKSCYPLTKQDKEVDSPYNTYKYKGLPPAPISNPGEEAIRSVLEAKSSPYWYYLSDPKTKRTIFSKTLEEHIANIRRYL